MAIKKNNITAEQKHKKYQDISMKVIVHTLISKTVYSIIVLFIIIIIIIIYFALNSAIIKHK